MESMVDAELGLPVEAAAAAHRAINWAPTWPDIQIAVLSLARMGNSLRYLWLKNS